MTATRRRFRIRHAILLALLVALLAAMVGCADYARHRLYATSQGRPPVPEWTGAPGERITATTHSGLRLAGYYWPPRADEHDVILVLHGRRDNYARMAGYIQRLAESGRGVLVASYRGFNDNPGAATEDAMIEDAQAFYRLARADAGPDGAVFVFGHSLGGAVAIQLAAREPLDGVVTLGTFTDIDEAAPYYAEWFIPDKWRSIDALADVDEPVFFLHGADDRFVTPDQAEELYAAACSPAAIMLIAGVKHRPNIHIIAPLITGWIDALEHGGGDGMRVEGAAEWESKPACR